MDIGRECARHGVKAIQLTGWNDGGQDRGNPSHKTDPRLGTWEDLRDAIAEMQDMDVKVVLFSKFTWADRSTEWFATELHRYATKDPYGDAHWHMGYQYQTMTQLADINTRRFSPMCHNSSAWRNVAKKEFARVVDLGAAGMLYDECQHHWPICYCFDPKHGHHTPEHIYYGDGLLLREFRELTDQEAPDFLYAGEACYDLEHRYYSLSYSRIEGDEHLAFQRYIDPWMGLMVAASGFDDRRALNQCLLYRYIISYEPFNFKGRIESFPITLEYGKSIDGLRRRYREYFWDAEYRDTLGARVTIDGKTHSPYTVFQQLDTGRQAVVVVNLLMTEAIAADVSLDRPSQGTRLVMATPEQPEAQAFDGTVTIPPRSAAVIMEQ